MRCHPYFGDRTWWLVEGEPLPPPSGDRYPSPEAYHALRCNRWWWQRMAKLDPTKADA